MSQKYNATRSLHTSASCYNVFCIGPVSLYKCHKLPSLISFGEPILSARKSCNLQPKLPHAGGIDSDQKHQVAGVRLPPSPRLVPFAATRGTLHLTCIFSASALHFHLACSPAICAPQCFDSATPELLHVHKPANPGAGRWEVCRILTSFKVSAVIAARLLLIYLARRADVISQDFEDASGC